MKTLNILTSEDFTDINTNPTTGWFGRVYMTEANFHTLLRKVNEITEAVNELIIAETVRERE